MQPTEDANELKKFIQQKHDKYPQMKFKLVSSEDGRLVLSHECNYDFGLSQTTPFYQSGTIETIFGHVNAETDPLFQLLEKSTCNYSKWFATPVNNRVLSYMPGDRRVIGMQRNGNEYVETYCCD